MGSLSVPPLPNPPIETSVTQTTKEKLHPDIVRWLLKLTATVNNITGGGSGTVTTSGSPAAGDLTVFSAPTVITNGNLSGDVTTSGTLTTALSTTGVSASTYGDSTHVGQFTVDAKGRLTAASNVAIVAGTVTTTGSPASGNLTKFSGASSITNGDLSGDVTTSGTLVTALASNQKIASIAFVIDGGGSAITTGVKGFLQIPFGCTITSWTILSTDASATSGSIVIDIWKDVFANYPPTVSDTIIPSGTKPTLSSAQAATSSSLSGWTTSITAADVLGFNVDSITTVTRITIQLAVTKT